MELDIIVTGAGAAGLMAASKLAQAGLKVLILEARDRTGGRIYTFTDPSFSSFIELGAEFVHGNLPLTSRLLKDAGITYEPVAGEIYHFEHGVLQKDAGPNKYWKEFKQKLSTIEKDVSLREFLDKSFADRRYAGLVRSVESFASGFDTADISQASAVALRNEWFGDEENAINYHISKGYSAMLKHLERQVEAGGGKLYLSKTVQQITWEKGKVNVLTTDREEFTAPKVIITVPLGVLQAEEGEGVILFKPAIPDKLREAKKLGFGAVVKILLETNAAFFGELQDMMPQLGFLLSDTSVPAWWTRFPEKSTLLTRWIGGPKAAALTDASENEIFDLAIASLQQIMKKERAEIKKSVKSFRIMNWTKDIFTRGSYSYPTVETEQAIKALKQPVAGTVFFAGEALYEGAVPGTVEAALASGKEVAASVLKISA